MENRYPQEDLLDVMRLLVRSQSPTMGVAVEGDDYTLDKCLALFYDRLNNLTQKPQSCPSYRMLLSRYGLTNEESAILWLAVAPHLEPAVGYQMAGMNEGLQQPYLTVGVCVALLSRSLGERMLIMDALAANGTLVRRGLLSVALSGRSGVNRLYHDVLPAPTLISYLMGRRNLSPSLQRLACLHRPPQGETCSMVPDAIKHIADELSPYLKAYWHQLPSGPDGADDFAKQGEQADRHLYSSSLGLLLQGERGSGRMAICLSLAGGQGRGCIQLDGSLLASLSPTGEAGNALEDALFEADLHRELLVIHNGDDLVGQGTKWAPLLCNALSQRQAAVVVTMGPASSVDSSLDAHFVLKKKVVPILSDGSLRSIWAWHLTRFGLPLDEKEIDAISEQLSLNPLQIRNTARLGALLGLGNQHKGADEKGNRKKKRTPASDGPKKAKQGSSSGRGAGSGSGLRRTGNAAFVEEVARHQMMENMGHLASGSRPTVRLRDLFLSDEVEAQIQTILAAVCNRNMVLKEWGLGTRIHRGVGICCLFDGEPGTGKTLAAEVIAGELGLVLMRVNISSIVDKYIGETEKNLTRIFERCRPDSSLLLFDEADSLFSRRTEVSRSVDRYSNMDINVLLQLIEKYEGVAILTTNLKDSIDKAFERRLTFKVNFPMPDGRERQRIWRYLLPSYVPVGGKINYKRLACYQASGGQIKNAVLNAAYAAVQEQSLLKMSHLSKALEDEVVSSGRLVRDGDDYDF